MIQSVNAENTPAVNTENTPDIDPTRWRSYLARAVQGLLLFLPETFIGSQGWQFLFIVYSLAVFHPKFDRRDNLFLIFVALVALNSILGVIFGHQPVSIFASNGVVGAATLLLAFLAARTMNSVSWTVVLGLIVLEAAATFYQVATGTLYFSDVQTFKASTIPTGTDVGRIDILYSIRPLGFSYGSTIVSFKLVYGLIMLVFLPLPRWIRLGVFIFLGAALVLNFKRSSVLAMFLLAAAFLIRDILVTGWTVRHVLIFLVAAVGGVFIMDEVARQFSLGRYTSFLEFIKSVDILDAGGRYSLWVSSLNYITDNPLFGNFSSRLIHPQSFFQITAPTSSNSYIAFVAMHGLIATAIFGFYVYNQLKELPARFFLLLPIFILAIFDEIVFYYVSIADIFFYYILTSNSVSLFPGTTSKTKSEREPN